MGSGASTTTTKVERIRIDSNGDIWKKKKNGTEKLCRPTSGMRPLSGIQRRIQNRSNSIHSNKGKDMNGSNEKLNSNIENLKFIQNELEGEVERLKHEIQRLEWEKAELINDVAFQKNKMQHSSNAVNGFFKGQTINEEENAVSAVAIKNGSKIV
uniref:Uncharacterized protein n=1 Tax=Panagrolaimus sp. PS1159 TaxID=55785 RepID=A0AC35GDI4_9BILA